MTQLVTVFGGDGFVGRYVVEALLKSGARVRVASRNPKRGWFLKAQATLGQISFAAADVTRPETLGVAVAGADAVINLVGILKGNYDLVQHIGAQNVAEAATAAGVRALVHLSAIGANPASISAYGRAKGDGEAAVLRAFPKAVILRPSIIFGREDSFINRFAGLIRALPVVPVIGGTTKFQPVYVGDVAHAIVAALGEGHAGKTYELGGPQVFSMADLNRWIAKATGRNKMFVPVPDQVAALMAKLTGWLPGAPITWDQWLMLGSDNVVAPKAKALNAFGITPTPLDVIAAGWLVQYRTHGRFGADAS